MDSSAPKAARYAFTTDADLVVQSWSEAAAHATGYPASVACGRTLGRLFPAPANAPVFQRLHALWQEPEPANLRWPIEVDLDLSLQPQPDTPPARLRVRVFPLRDKDELTGLAAELAGTDDTAATTTEALASGDESSRARAAMEAAGASAAQGQVGADLIRALGDPSWRVRRAAVHELARHATPELVERLVRALREHHDDAAVLNSALSALTMAGLDAVTPLSRLLEDPDAAVRTYAAQALGLLGNVRAVPALIRAVETDADANVRYHAIEALGRLEARDAEEVLLRVAGSGDFFLAFAAIEALGRLGDAAVAVALAPRLEDAHLRPAVIEALGRMGDLRVVGPLTAVLSKEAALAAPVARALKRLHDRLADELGEEELVGEAFRRSVEPAGVERLLTALETASAEDLPALVAVLGWADSPEVAPALARLLARPALRREVVEALVRHGGRATDWLVEQTRSEDPEVREAAVTALGRVGDASAVPALLAVAQHDPALLVPVAGALGRIGDPRALEPLLDLLGHEKAPVRMAAIAALNSLGHPELAARVRPLLRDPDPRKREVAARIVGYFGYPECLEDFFACCTDEEEAVRAAAVEALGVIEDERAGPLLAQAMEAESARVRAAAVHALGQRPAAEALPWLERAVEDADPWVRYEAAKALGLLAAPEGLPLLEAMAVEDPAIYVRAAALEALGQLGGAEAVRVLAGAAKCPNPDLARPAIHALGEVGHPDAIPVLFDAAKRPEPGLRLEAVRSLGRRGGPQTAGALEWVATMDPDESVRIEAVRALGTVVSEETVAVLAALAAEEFLRPVVVETLSGMGEPGLGVMESVWPRAGREGRQALVHAWARMKCPRATGRILAALDDPDPAVRRAACLALGRLGAAQAAARLRELAETDPDPGVRRAARQSLEPLE